MPLRKSHLYSSLWKSCDELRGGMDASQYKDYILTLLFMKYVSDKYAGSDDFADIAAPPGGSFASAKRSTKAAQTELDAKVLARYETLTEVEVAEIIVDDKWMASIEGAIGKEVERLTGGLVDRVRDLEGRYADALPELERRVEDYGAKVEGHLKRMGLPA